MSQYDAVNILRRQVNQLIHANMVQQALIQVLTLLDTLSTLITLTPVLINSET